MQKFAAAIKKGVSTGKLGEAAFKPNEEGSYFNAFPTIAETLKQIEDAIVQSGANGGDAIRPGSAVASGGVPGTAGSKNKAGASSQAVNVPGDGMDSK